MYECLVSYDIPYVSYFCEVWSSCRLSYGAFHISAFCFCDLDIWPLTFWPQICSISMLPFRKFWEFFYRTSSYGSTVLDVVIPSVRPSVTRVLCDKIKQCTADILTPHEKESTLVFWHQQWLAVVSSEIWAQRPTPFETHRLRQISAYNVSTVTDSEKSSIIWNRRSTTDFPTSYSWSAYVIPKCPNGLLKKRFF